MITYVRESVVTVLKANYKNDLAVKDEQISKLYERIVELKQRIESLGSSLKN